METYPRSEHSEPISQVREIQNGDPREYKNFSTTRGVGDLNRLQGCIFPHPHSPSLQEVSEISCQGHLLPIQSSAFRSVYCSNGVYDSGKGGQTHGSKQGYKDPPVLGRLAGQSKFLPSLPTKHSKFGSPLSRSWLGCKSRKIRAGTKTSFQLCRLPVRLADRQGQTHPGKVAEPSRKSTKSFNFTPMQGQTTHVSHRAFDSHRETGSPRSSAHETHPMAFKESLEDTRVIGKTDSNPKIPAPTFEVVDPGSECPQRSTPPSFKSLSSNFHRRFRRRLGCSFRGSGGKGPVVPARKQVAHKLLRAESSFSGSKTVSKYLLRKYGAYSDRQHYSRRLYQQGRRHEVRTALCSPLENTNLVYQASNHPQGSTHSRSPECDCRQALQTRPDHPDRVVSPPRGFPIDLQPLVSTASRSICNQVQPQVTSVCFSSTGPSGLGSGRTQPSLGGPGSICIPTNSPSGQGGVQTTGPSMQENHSDSSRLAQNALVLGSSGPVSADPFVPSHPTEPIDPAIQSDPSQRSTESKSPCLVPRATAIKERGYSEAVATRIEAPQRSSTRSVYGAKWSIFTKWCKDHKVDLRAPPITSIADFLLHLFEEKNLQPSTIDGYRSAIADKLGNSPINISKNEDLTRLLDSFHRDRPKGRRGIPSWNLSLVLHHLTKAPFEPLQEASLKHLTFKTVFLLALGSGKRRSEIHAWLNKNIRNQKDWSNVSLYPAASFLSKNQLAKDGPGSVAPVVIPALAPTLDRSCVGDRTLCPVRALRYYLDRTKDIRQEKELVFVSFKKGFTKDISPATISSWIKQTVLLCYELSDKDSQTLHQVKAHDVRAFAASKAFHSGASLEQLLSACHWKSHNTFTQFYLKDVAWADSELYHLGPVVAAQQIHK